MEAGVGTATLQALYGPVGCNDRDSINGILAATDRYYKRTGVIYLIAFCILAFIYPLAVASDLRKSAIFLVIVLGKIQCSPFGRRKKLHQQQSESCYLCFDKRGKNHSAAPWV